MNLALSHLTRTVFLFFILIIPNLVSASTTDGTIDSTYHYAWSENAGWVDFGSVAGNVHVTDSILTGSVYGENIGWVTLNPQTYGGVTNNSEGVLSGYAWGENIGWLDFSHVTIGSDGIFSGGAYSENIGWITFGTGDNKVLTDWRPLSTRTPQPNTEMGGVYSTSWTVNPWDIVVHAPIIPTTTPPVIITPVSPQVFMDTLNIPKTTISQVPQIFRNLSVMSTGNDVKQLQQFLNNNGFLISTNGNGSPSNETEYFGIATKNALMKFQVAHGITPSNGYFGPITRDFIKNKSLKRLESPNLENKSSNIQDKISIATSTIPIIVTEVKASIPSSSSIFTRDLSFGMSGKDVLSLQEFLIKQNTGSASQALMEDGSSDYFGILTKAALIEFQEKNNITPANGYFGSITKAVIENIIKNPILKISPPEQTELENPKTPVQVPEKTTTFPSKIIKFLKSLESKP